MPLKLPTRYKKLVKHKRRPNKVRDAYSEHETRVVKVNRDGSYVTKNTLSGRLTKYTKTGRRAAKQKF